MYHSFDPSRPESHPRCGPIAITSHVPVFSPAVARQAKFLGGQRHSVWSDLDPDGGLLSFSRPFLCATQQVPEAFALTLALWLAADALAMPSLSLPRCPFTP
eukprot:EG_transcript_52660